LCVCGVVGIDIEEEEREKAKPNKDSSRRVF
jgi:hypothetical protein